jgi:hypothetical protein
MELISKLITSISLCICIIGCDSQGETSASTQPAAPTSDTVKRENKKTDTGFAQIELHKGLQDYIKAYKDTVRVDTSLEYNHEKLKISFKHYCTYDSALHLPSKYIGIYGLKEFTTHDFKSILKISSGENLIIDTTITKEMFKDKIFEEEKSYGALLYPHLSFSDKGVTIDYSISIPLTDVGVGASLECSYDGKLSMKK